MKTVKYRIFETPDGKHVLAAVNDNGGQHPLVVGLEADCQRVITDIINGDRDELGCKEISAHEIDFKEDADIN